MPITVGIAAARAVYFILPVSFFIVRSVVEQGQWKSEKIITFTAVNIVQPLVSKIFRKMLRSEISVRVVLAQYAIKIKGITISFAGRPKINAMTITPSRPKSRPNGSKKSEMIFSSEAPSTLTLAKNQISSPAGAAAIRALKSTNKVLSKTECIITFNICGLR